MFGHSAAVARRCWPRSAAGRICRGVELRYVDVAIKRFQQNHPGVPVTLIATGQSFDEIATEREMEVAA